MPTATVKTSLRKRPRCTIGSLARRSCQRNPNPKPRATASIARLWPESQGKLWPPIEVQSKSGVREATKKAAPM
ncbi:hypothetical protein D3C72_1705410 [compost metagenome]